jgi:ABC-type dipeptide/oligopeptide/nickel transport system ATPase subunit
MALKGGSSLAAMGAGGAGKAATTSALTKMAQQAAIQTAMAGAMQGGKAAMQPDVTTTNPQNPGMLSEPELQAMIQELMAKRSQANFQFLPTS